MFCGRPCKSWYAPTFLGCCLYNICYNIHVYFFFFLEGGGEEPTHTFWTLKDEILYTTTFFGIFSIYSINFLQDKWELCVCCFVPLTWLSVSWLYLKKTLFTFTWSMKFNQSQYKSCTSQGLRQIWIECLEIENLKNQILLR